MTRDKNAVFEIDGIKFGFRFTTWSFQEAQKGLAAKSINEVLRRIGFSDGELDTVAFIVFLREAAKEYNFQQGIQKTVTDRDTAGYIDLMGGVIEALEKISEALNASIPKNSSPLESQGNTP